MQVVMQVVMQVQALQGGESELCEQNWTVHTMTDSESFTAGPVYRQQHLSAMYLVVNQLLPGWHPAPK